MYHHDRKIQRAIALVLISMRKEAKLKGTHIRGYMELDLDQPVGDAAAYASLLFGLLCCWILQFFVGVPIIFVFCGVASI